MEKRSNNGHVEPVVRPPIQDAGQCSTDELCIPVYHTHGRRQYLGTCKIHITPECCHLVNWQPGRCLGKTIMREWKHSLDDVPWFARCKSCWPNDKNEREP